MLFKIIGDNRIIGSLFSACIVLNAHAIEVGWYR